MFLSFNEKDRLIAPFARVALAAAAFIAFALAPLHTRASDSAAEFSLREWHGADGLPDEVVRVIVQDAQGYLWVATESGIVRFNGLRFDNFAPPLDESALADVASVGSRGVPAIVSHPEHGLLFAYDTGEIWQWSGSAFRRAPVARLFSAGRIESWFTQANGALWADFLNGRIEYVHNGRVTRVMLGHSLLAGRPVSFADDGEGGVWIAARSALYHFRAQDAADAAAQTGDSPSVSLPPHPVDFGRDEICVAASRSGKPWIMVDTTLGRWDGHRIVDSMQMPRLLGAHFAHVFKEDNDGDLWVGTRSQGAYMVKAAGDEYIRMPASHRQVRAVCQDSEGNVWLGTNGGGLNRLQIKRFRLYDTSSGLDDDLTLTVSEDKSGAIWLANRDGGMVRVRKGKITKNPPGWPVVSAGRVVPDNDGGVWFTAGSGLFRAGETDDLPKRVPGPAPFKNMRVLFVSRANQLWIGGVAGEIGCYTAGGFVTLGPADGFPASHRPGAIVEDAAGRIIVGTSQGGLFRCDPSAELLRFETLRAPDAPPLGAVRSLLLDDDATLWIGTGGAGVTLITATGVEHRIDKDAGLPGEMISQMLFDDHGRVWFGSAHGIFSVERSEVMDYVTGRIDAIHPLTFGLNEGFDHITCLNGYQPHCWKARDGTLWFTTRRGALAIDPHALNQAREPSVYIDAMLVDGERLAPTPAKKGGSFVKLRADARRVEFLFSALNLTAPERTAVRYRLEGFDTAWQPAGTARKLVYPRLYPGEYRMQIDAADENGQWNRSGGDEIDALPDAMLTIIVEPFWWQTLWFRITVVLVAAALLVAAVRAWSFRRLRLRLERSERQVAISSERTRIARDIHDDIGASLTRISLLSQFNAVPSASAPGAPPPSRRETEQSDSLREIHTTADHIARSINQIVWAIEARHDNLDSMVNYFDSYAQHFLAAAKIRYRLRAPERLADTPVSSRVRHDLFLAFKEALNNCAKYSEAAEVLVTIALDDSSLTLSVADDGRGITPGATSPGGGGQGLSYLQQRLSTIGGRAIVRAGQNQGTEVVFTMPLSMINA